MYLDLDSIFWLQPELRRRGVPTRVTFNMLNTQIPPDW